MSTQFVRLEGYGRRPKAGAEKWQCVAGVVGEAARAPGACGHLKNPGKPVPLFGMSPVEAGALAAGRAEGAVDAIGRSVRADGNILFALVASFPIPEAELHASHQDLVRYRQWETATLAWLQKEFGAALTSVVAHHDEEFPHLHAFIVPALTGRGTLDVAACHPGYRARVATLDAGGSAKDGEKAYRKAMSAFQDRYHQQVGGAFGHERFGPRRRRAHRIVAAAEADAAARQRSLVAKEEVLAARLKDRQQLDRYVDELQAAYEDGRKRERLLEAELAKLRQLIATDDARPAEGLDPGEPPQLPSHKF